MAEKIIEPEDWLIDVPFDSADWLGRPEVAYEDDAPEDDSTAE